MNETPQPSLLKLRADSTFVATADGVWLRNNRGAYFVRGKSAYLLIRSLFRLLDGTRTIEEICAGLTHETRRAVEQQLVVLLERGFAREVAPPRSEPPTWLRPLYADHLDFLAEFAPDPVDRFLCFRNQRMACVGSGVLLRAMLVALVEHGAGKIDVIDFGKAGEDEGALDSIVEPSRERDPRMEISLIRDAAALSGAHPSWERYDAVVVAATRPHQEAVARIAETAVPRISTFGAVAPVGKVLLSSPLITSRSPVCWECVRRSLFISDAAPEVAEPAPPSAALACQRLAHALFCHYAGVQQPADGMAMTVDCEALTVRSHRITQHPACVRHPEAVLRPWDLAVEDGPRPDIPRSTDSVESSERQDTIVRRTRDLIDKVSGPLLSVGEDDLPQVPLAATRCTARAVMSTPELLASHVLLCRGLSARETRNQVVLLAFEHLAHEAAATSRAVAALQSEVRAAGPAGAFQAQQESVSDGRWRWAFGAGWTPAEACYRALCRASLSWAIRSMWPSIPDAELSPGIRHDPGALYLLQALESRSAAPSAVAICVAPTGLFVVRVTNCSGESGFGVGATATEASVNALAKLACQVIDPSPADWTVVEPAHMIPGAPTWRELLQSAETARRGQRVTVAYWDAGDLLPFCANRAWIALLGVRSLV